MKYTNLLVEKRDAVAVLTVNRPKALNSLNSEVIEELLAALTEIEGNAGLKVAVITGSGEKAFVAGADIAEMSGLNVQQALAFSRKGQQVVNFIGRMTKPVIAAVNGFALGGGLELALACDFVYAAESAKLGFPEVTLGIMPGFGGTQKLGRIIGRGRANELIFTGRLVTAAEALDWGMVNGVLPGGELLDRAIEMATKIAGNGLLGVAGAKDAIRSGLDMGEADGLNYESVLFASLFASADQKEGMQAFLDKRKAAFTGA
ncbi:enoyl-CoA hydratase-related protein [Geotalea sp. SG265]|uniref:enoyl-CoA hydratase/isomerase family protein n=1 Tax=Geotalea sp. SG265 TaxID=2922867 RepID=UPI001FAFA958|nr:enoyl-CoA hydratase-related protein [Geotalea sp. SG265]